jgi:hypothetical protein
MDPSLEIDRFAIDDDLTVVVPARVVPRRLRLHAFAALMIGGALIGGALRLLPTSTAAATTGGVASTSCSAK